MHSQPNWRLGNGEQGLVSYVILAFNVEAYITPMLDSCLKQDYRPLELVVVIDGATDRTDAVVREFQSAHAGGDLRVQRIVQANAGLNVARNVGLKASTGSIIGFLDSDDLIPPNRTRLLHSLLIDHAADVAYGPCVQFREVDQVQDYLSSGRATVEDSASIASCTPTGKWVPNVWSFLMRRELAERVGPLSEHLRLCWPDVDYTVRLRFERPKMVRTSTIVNLYRSVSGSNADKSKPDAIVQALDATRTIDEFFQRNAVTDSESRRWLGGLYWKVALWAIRLQLKNEASIALQGAAECGAGSLRTRARLMRGIMQLPLGLRSTSALLRTSSGVRASMRRRRGG